MRTPSEIKTEIDALNRLASSVSDDPLAQASIAGQVNVLEWVLRQPDDLPATHQD